MRRDLAGNGPVPINLKTNQIISPDHTGNLRMPPGQPIDLICFDVFNHIEQRIINVYCHKHQYFYITDELDTVPISISSIKCKTPVRTNIQVTSEDKTVIQNVKFGFTNPSGFANFIDIYINITELRPLLSHHVLGPGATKAFTANGQGFSFRQDNIFPPETQLLYTKAKQKTTICDDILGISKLECDTYFGGSQKFLVRGHLGPAADFEYRAGYWASYSYANVAPQWQSINNGHWSSMERSVRQMAERYQRSLDVVTGTLGILQLNNNKRVPKNITLNVNGQLPVPAVFYKLIIDRTEERAVAVIISNNPFGNNGILICEDQTKHIQWMSLLFVGSGDQKLRVDRHTDDFRSRGFVYTCRLEDFLKNARGVPSLDVWRNQSFKLLFK